jgi:peptidoglycan hydrolase CwlO-like protein
MGDTVSKKLDAVLVEVGKLSTNISNLDKKFDSLESEFRTFKKEYGQSVERIVRLEVADETTGKALNKIEVRFSEQLDVFQKLNDERVEKKLLALKLAIFTSIAAVVFSLVQFAFNIFKG